MTERPELPGENGFPDERRRDPRPVTEDEALGYARHLARLERDYGRSTKRPAPEIPDELPEAGRRIPAAYRFDGRLLSLARAKAAIEQTTVTAILEDALAGYVAAPPDAVALWLPMTQVRRPVTNRRAAARRQRFEARARELAREAGEPTRDNDVDE